MRLNLHDFSGHPFQIELSRELARRGHEVLHTYSTQYITGHGRLTPSPDDPPTLHIEGIRARRPMVKYSPLGRVWFELSYAAAWQRWLDAHPVDVAVACNIPLFALDRMQRWFGRRKLPWVLWHQDLYSLGVSAEAARRWPSWFASPVSRRLQALEVGEVGAATAVVAITDAMTAQYKRWEISHPDVSVIGNWAPLSDISVSDRENGWADRHDLPSAPLRLLYAGTLGRKHNPALLVQLLDEVKRNGVDATLVVVSEGIGAEIFAAAAGERPDVRLLPYQPAEELSAMLGSADALVALLEPQAADFSVPSKVLSYLAAGRAVVALMPDHNPAAADVISAGGVVAAPDDAGVRDAAAWLAGQVAAGTLANAGRRARRFAEDNFDVVRIGDAFEEIALRAADRRGAHISAPSTVRMF